MSRSGESDGPPSERRPQSGLEEDPRVSVGVSAISVVIPTHLRAGMLDEALETVISQTVPPSEIIVVSDADDASTTRVVDTAATRAACPVRLVENLEAPGASGSRNAGAREANGNLLAFLDDDDLWTAEHLSECLRVLTESGADLAVAGIEVFNSESSGPGIQLRPGVSARDAATSVHGVTGSNILIHAAAFWSVGGFDPALRHLNDRDFFYRSRLGGLSYVISPRLTTRYRKHDGGQLSGASEGRARGVAAYLAKHRRSLSLSDRRKLRYQSAVMRYRCADSWTQRTRWLVWAALNASYPRLLGRLRRRGGQPAVLSGRSFDTDTSRT